MTEMGLKDVIVGYYIKGVTACMAILDKRDDALYIHIYIYIPRSVLKEVAGKIIHAQRS